MRDNAFRHLELKEHKALFWAATFTNSGPDAVVSAQFEPNDQSPGIAAKHAAPCRVAFFSKQEEK